MLLSCLKTAQSQHESGNQESSGDAAARSEELLMVFASPKPHLLFRYTPKHIMLILKKSFPAL